MIPELGHFALVTALGVAFIQGVLPLFGAHRRNAEWIALARPAAGVVMLLLTIAFLCLVTAFVQNDFSVLYVARHSHTLLPLPYRIAAVWSGHEGSLLLWILMQGLWTAAVAFFSKSLPEEMAARIIAVLGWIIFGFLLFILLTSNPFERLLPGAEEGNGLNPLLQDTGLILHPPMLYMGYVGFSVPFAFAVAALISGRINTAWTRWSRPWTIAAWIFLTLGIALGSIWAYYELGWGGWWFWDPVENASFMPWLMGTALMHSLAVTEKRGSFKNWTTLLAIFTFSLSLFGTFLVRSGVLTSVHSFVADPRRGTFILFLLMITVGSSLALFAWRAPRIGDGGRFGLLSRESLLLTNSVLLIVVCASILLGTLYPLLIDVLGLGKLSVGAPYFETVFVPLMTPILFLIGLAPFAHWKQASLPELFSRLGWAFLTAAMIGLVVPFLLNEWKPMVALGLLLAAWIALAGGLNLIQRIQTTRNEGPFLKAFARLPAGFLGMHLAHSGIAVFIVGVAIVNGYQAEKEVKMDAGSTVTLAGYSFRFNGIRQRQGQNYQALVGDIDLIRNGRTERKLFPEKRFYSATNGNRPMTEAAIDVGFLRDIYVSLDEPTDKTRPEGIWIIRVCVKPFVGWIWGGCLLMSLGGLLAVCDRRYRLGTKNGFHFRKTPA